MLSVFLQVQSAWVDRFLGHQLYYPWVLSNAAD